MTADYCSGVETWIRSSWVVHSYLPRPSPAHVPRPAGHLLMISFVVALCLRALSLGTARSVTGRSWREMDSVPVRKRIHYSGESRSGSERVGEGTGMGELCTKCRFNERLAVMCVCVCVRRRLPRG